MIRNQAYLYRLKPTVEQINLLHQFLGCSRFVWNSILSENTYRFEVGDPLKLNYLDFAKRLQHLKLQFLFLQDVHSQPLQQTLKDLGRAYSNAFNPKLAQHFPVLKKKNQSHGIRFPQGFKVEHNRLYLPKIGWVHFCLSKRTRKRKILGTIKNVTVRLHAGKFTVSIQTERETEVLNHQSVSGVGIDVGVTRFAALSDETFYDAPNPYLKHSRKLKRLQRQLSKKVKFSKNWQKSRKKATKVHSHIANVRKDFVQKVSTTISKNHAIVVVEDLKIGNMTKSAKGTIEKPGTNVKQKSGLNRRILDQGWGKFFGMLDYKLRRSGGTLIFVDAKNTSRTCNTCNFVSAENRKIQEHFVCIQCSHESNADTNAAKNIFRRAGYVLDACGGLTMVGPMKQEATVAASLQPESSVFKPESMSKLK